MKLRRLWPAPILLLAVAMGSALSLSDGSVTAVAHGPAGLRIEARTSKIEVSHDGATLVFSAPLTPLQIGIDLRDRHLRQMLETEAFPSASLRVLRADLSLPRDREPSEGVARGELTLHGKSRPVDVRYRAEVVGARITRVRGSFALDVRDFGVTPPSYLGLAVSPMVDIDAELVLTDGEIRAQQMLPPGVAAGSTAASYGAHSAR
jgi:polyisoprenoid-binding protein YceI